MNSRDIRILIIDHDPGKHKKFSSTLNAQDGIKVVKIISNTVQALTAMQNETIHLVLINIDKPTFGSAEIIKSIRQLYSDIRIVIFSAFEYGTFCEDLLVQAINAGVQGFLSKDMPVGHVAQMLKQSYRGYPVFASKPAMLLMNSYVEMSRVRNKYREFAVQIEKLPIRLRSTFNLLLEMRTNNEIAQILCMQPSTIRSYVSDILAHTGCVSRGELAVTAAKAGVTAFK